MVELQSGRDLLRREAPAEHPLHSPAKPRVSGQLRGLRPRASAGKRGRRLSLPGSGFGPPRHRPRGSPSTADLPESPRDHAEGVPGGDPGTDLLTLEQREAQGRALPRAVAQEVRNADAVLARLGARSKGVVTREELLAAGVSSDEAAHRTRTGALIAVYRGVYRVGHAAPSVEASYLAAVRACGEGAGLSGDPAGWLLGLVRGKPPPPEVSAPTEHRIPGLKTRRRRLGRSEIIIHRGIPVTSVALTLCDLAGGLSKEGLALACHEAGVKYRTTPRMVEEALARRPRTRGAGKLRAVIRGEARVTLSRLESSFLELLSAEGLPLPVTNRPAGARHVDCRWPERRLTVELDSYTYHSSRHAWETDRHREREAYARGDEFRRYTWGDVFERPRLMLAGALEVAGVRAAARPRAIPRPRSPVRGAPPRRDRPQRARRRRRRRR